MDGDEKTGSADGRVPDGAALDGGGAGPATVGESTSVGGGALPDEDDVLADNTLPDEASSSPEEDGPTPRPGPQSRHRGGGREGNARTRARHNARQCIVTRARDPAERLIRFVADPEGRVVPDLAGKLPGRGAHVTARRDLVDEAQRRNLFARALKQPVRADPDLAERTGALMREALVRMLPLMRKSGALVSGAGKVDGAVRSGEALLVLHAREAAGDGVRKIDQARHAVARDGGPEIGCERGFTSEELGLAFDDAHVIHAALLRTGGGERFVRRLSDYHSYCMDGHSYCVGGETGRHTHPSRGSGGAEPPTEQSTARRESKR